MRTILLIASLALATGASAKSWPGVPYAEVRAYAYNTRGELARPILNGQPGTVDRTAKPKAGVRLTAAQTKTLLTAVTGRHPEHPIAACYVPRHAFVFYSAEGSPVAHIEICFECFGYRAEPKGTAIAYDLPRLADLCRGLGLEAAPESEFRQSFDSLRRAVR